jgi:hypothetical protein
MSTLSKKVREDRKSKAADYVRNDPHARVDASGYTPDGALNGDVQTGMRVLSRRQYRRGGSVEGSKSCAHVGRKPRATGGKAIAQELMNRNQRDANKDRDGIKFIGGFMHGGRAHKAVGGPMGMQPVPTMQRPMPGLPQRPARASGGKVHKDEAQDKALIHKMGCGCSKCSGGRVGRKSGGGTRPKGGRIARQGGGRAKKGMNVNIIIAPSQPQKPMMPPPGGPPMPPGAGPVGMHQGPPPPPAMPPPGAAAPMGMPRKDGGAVVGHFAKPGKYPLKDGSGGGKGRKEKIKAYG